MWILDCPHEWLCLRCEESWFIAIKVRVSDLFRISRNDELADISYWDDIEKYQTDIRPWTPE